MKAFIVLSALVAVAVASPGYLASAVVPYHGYHAGAPVGLDGRVVDTPEVAHAKAAHLAAHAHEASRNHHAYAPALAYGAAPALAHGYGAHAYAPALAYGYHHAGAPIGHDGRVVDTPEVAHAKAAHFAAHAHEAAKTGYGVHAYGAHAYGDHAYGDHAYGVHAYGAPALAYAAAPVYAHGYAHGAPIGHDGRVVDTPEVAHAKAAHLAAHAHEAAKTAHAVHYW